MTEIDFHHEQGDTWADVLRRALDAYRGMAQRHPAAFALVAASRVDRPPVTTHLANAATTLSRTGISLDSAWAVLAIADAFATGLLHFNAATKATAEAAPRPGTETVEVESQIQRFRDYVGDEVWRQGIETIIAGAQRTLDLPPVPYGAQAWPHEVKRHQS